MFHATEDILGLLRVPGCRAQEENGEGGRLGPLGDVDDFLETRHTQGHVLGGDTGEVEGVEGHLGGWFTEALGCKGANHLTWTDLHH